MLWSKSFITTLKEMPQEAETLSHQLMLRAGLIRMLLAGIYSYLPLGYRVLARVEEVIRQEMDACGANELLLPALQPLDLWKKSGRDELMGEVMIRFTDRRGRDLCLGPTHEEVVTELVKNCVSSYKQLPRLLYQVQTKFRDEIRPRFGLIRACEFIMKDAYSFDRNEEGLDRNYQLMFEAYKRIFARCGLRVLTTKADPGVMGGEVSHEFMVPASNGEDAVLVCEECDHAKVYTEEGKEKCPNCNTLLKKINAIEIGHIFKLGTKYSSALGAQFSDSDGQLKPLRMGCYGIGVSRLIPTIIEQNHDAEGIIWPKEVSPFKATVVALDITDSKIIQAAGEIYAELTQRNIDTLFDERDERAGVKFKDADLVGIPVRVVVGRKNILYNKIEVIHRRSKETLVVERKGVPDAVADMLRTME
ncbi:MAG: proline--tRNA ligase [Candidatus Omnitrophica bacterium]|nr:proline--tRNA ligase [Candidatus Omnitrophota bacterium]